jgi:hypothetical protein
MKAHHMRLQDNEKYRLRSARYELAEPLLQNIAHFLVPTQYYGVSAERKMRWLTFSSDRGHSK